MIANTFNLIDRHQRTTQKTITKFIQEIIERYVRDYGFFQVYRIGNELIIQSKSSKRMKTIDWQVADTSTDLTDIFIEDPIVRFNIRLYRYNISPDIMDREDGDTYTLQVGIPVDELYIRKSFLGIPYTKVNTELLNEHLTMIKLDVYECFERFFQEDAVQKFMLKEL